MEVLIEQILLYGVVLVLAAGILIVYLLKHNKRSRKTTAKIERAKELGFHEPVSLHPVVDPDICLGSGACVRACPEKDILGLVNGKAETINAARCVGHGACFHACPLEAITLCIGTEKRGVELPHVSPDFETNISGLFIAGELGGMGLIKNAVEQGRQAMENCVKKMKKSPEAKYDVIIVGAGPSGISATLTAASHNLRFLTLEQDSLGGTVFNFPRAKIIMTSPMNLPLHGKLKLSETSKSELLELWTDVLTKNQISVNQQEKVESIDKTKGYFEVITSKEKYTANAVILCIGRRGSPRKLGVPGEEKEKVAYRLLEPELIHNQNVLIVGGGDSAIESALLLADENNNVSISYRSDSFARLKPKNLERINNAIESKKIRVFYNSNVKEIKDESVILDKNGFEKEIKNDLVFIFAGGELPIKFLEKIGITITKKFGEAILKHN
ncbi:MAG: 4Fe-4S ferredoxin [Ignavibacteria bacterium RBG_16_34_14]|nr:MAG: 4Fe-4S ferredoxin [Ignavibacteria bacterium RBG_16_34_14]